MCGLWGKELTFPQGLKRLLGSLGSGVKGGQSHLFCLGCGIRKASRGRCHWDQALKNRWMEMEEGQEGPPGGRMSRHQLGDRAGPQNCTAS